ncbi:MAG: cytochrome C554 [Ignavibacteriaceae bacterium]|nr:cytochrome C554 [Ignavibacteriaceae bacterium]
MIIKYFLSLLILVSPIYVSIAQEKKFVGVEACGMCHKTDKQGKQLSIWQESKHSKAYETLKSEESNRIAKEKGFTTLAVETPECLKCHASGYNVDASLKMEKFKVEDGVQCETCHGPGSEYKSLKVMKSREESIKNGLIVHDSLDKFCVNCHNPESPTFKEFDLTTMWEKIKHSVPK